MTKFGKVCLILGLMAAATIFNICINPATAGAADGYWSTAPPKFLSFIPDQTLPNCNGTLLQASVDGVGDGLPICLVDTQPTSGLRWGYYLNYGLPQPVISFNYEAKFYAITGLSYVPRATDYVAASDSLFVGNANTSGRLTIYEHVTRRLKRRTNLAQTYFEFDGSAPEYVSAMAVVGDIGVSNNGRYVVFEMRESGFALLDRKAMTIKQISTQAVHYGWGSDPAVELAVSDDGGLVVEAGLNTPFNVWAVSESCGMPIEPGGVAPPVNANCPNVNLPYADFLTTASVFYAPVFNDSNTILRFYLRGYDGRSGYVTLASAGSSNKMAYLALGDSYTSGEGELDNKFYKSGTDSEFEKCHLSLRSYPFLYGQNLGLPGVGVNSVACSGARTTDILGSNDDYWGQGKRLGSGGLNLTNDDRLSYQAQALDDFTPGRVRQLSFVAKYTPNLVTVGIGGNDSGLFGKLAACAMPGECEWVSDKGKAQTYQEINSLEPKLVDTYQKIKQASPSSRVFAVNYPQVINPEGHCDALTSAMFNANERRLINESIAHINDVIDWAATKAGVGVFDIEASFVGHRLCDDSSQLAVSSLRIGNDFGPGDSKLLHLLGNETFHPTPYGQQLVAAALYAQMSQLEQATSNKPKDNQSAADSDYWPQGITYPQSRNVELTTTPQIESLNMSFGVQLPANSLAPASEASVTIDDSASLSAPANQDGAFAVDLALPDNFSEGVHTVHIEGESPSGDRIDNYEMVSYNPPNESDDNAVNDIGDGDNVDQNKSDDNNQSSDTTDKGSTDDQRTIEVNPAPPSGGYNQFVSILPWGWRMRIDALRPAALSGRDVLPDDSPSFVTDGQKNIKSAGAKPVSAKSSQAVLGWSTSRAITWRSWLFGPIYWYMPFWLASSDQPGIMSPWLIFAHL